VYDTGEVTPTMALDPNDAAKRVLIAYRQLSEIVKEEIGVASAKAHIESYDRILATLNECFSVDKAFSDSISHIKPLGQSFDAMRASYQMESDGKVLLAAAHSFIEMHLSPENRNKAIGFHT
jgi:hypothetical protein